MKKSLLAFLTLLFWGGAIGMSALPAPAALPARPMQLYLVDRVRTHADYAQLAAWGINAAVVDISISASTATWQAEYDAANAAGVQIIIWPNQGGDVSGCGWETPFNSGNIDRVKPMLDYWGTRAIGIVTAHEPMWDSSSGCNDSVPTLTSLHNQIHAYVGNPGFEVYVYVDNISDARYLDGYTGPSDYDAIMDVGVTWQHCAGGAEGTCSSALSRINTDRSLLTAAGSNVKLIYLIQTFTAGGSYSTKFTLSELQTWSCSFINTSALDGFGYYTWDEGWYSGNLRAWTDLWPAVPYVYQTCIGGTVPTITPGGPTSTIAPPTATRTATAIPTITNTPGPTATLDPNGFTFVSASDAQGEVSNFTRTVNQVKTLNPAFILFNGDLENDGVNDSEMAAMTAPLKSAGLYNSFLPVRGNHDDPSVALWETWFEVTSPKSLPAGVTNYVSMSSSTVYSNYSFVYGNSMFIGLDIPGDMDLITSTQLTFMDARLDYAESQGLTHAFIFTHGPMYCAESTHCNCSTRTGASCTPSALIAVINQHPIISAFINGHEHLMAWTHLDSTRLATLTGSFEEFFTSPSGGWTYNSYLYPARVDYYYPSMGTSQAFASISVNGSAFTVNFYKVGVTAPVWSQTFTKGTAPATGTPAPATNTPTRTSLPPTATRTNTPVFTFTPTLVIPPTVVNTATPTATRTVTNTPAIKPTSTRTPTRTPVPLGVPSQSITLRWGYVSGATGYTLQISRETTFTTTLISLNTTARSYSPTITGSYFWRVRAYTSTRTGAWSPVWAINTAVKYLDCPGGYDACQP